MKRLLHPITLALGFPSVVVLVAHYGFGMQTSALTIAWIVLAFGIILGIADALMERRALRNRVTLDIKPNLVRTEGEDFPFDFSTRTQFIGSKTDLAAAIDAATGKALFGKRRVLLRPAVLARVWHEGQPLSEIELEALQEVLAERFCFPQITQIAPTIPGGGMSFYALASLDGNIRAESRNKAAE